MVGSRVRSTVGTPSIALYTKRINSQERNTMPLLTSIQRVADAAPRLLKHTNLAKITGLAIAATTLQFAAAHPGSHHAGLEAEVMFEGDAQLLAHAARLQLAVERDPHSPRHLIGLAQVRLRIARQTGSHAEYETAAQAAESAIAAIPQDAGGYLVHGHALIGLHRFSEALDAARTAMARSLSGPSEPAAAALLCDAHFALGHYVEAESLARDLVDRELTAESLGRLAIIRYERSDYPEAASLMRDAAEAATLLEAPPSTAAWCHTMLGDIERDAGNATETEAAYRTAIDLDPNAHAAFVGLAKLLAARGEIEEAETVLADVVSRFPRPKYRIAFAEVLLQHGEPHDLRLAAQQFTAAESAMLADVGTNPQAAMHDGNIAHARELVEYWLKHRIEEDADRGIADLAAAFAMADLEQRQDIGSYETAGWALHHAGRHEEAADLIQIALRIAPHRSATYRRAAAIFAGQLSVVRTP